MFTRKHALATRAASLGLLGVILLGASVGASMIESPSVPLHAVEQAVAAEGTPADTASVTQPTAPATATAEPAPPATATTSVPEATATTVPLQGGPSALDLVTTMLAPFNTSDLYSPSTSTPEAAKPEPEPTAEPEPVLDGIQIRTPYRTQFDGSTYEGGNCGIASIAMALEYYGITIGTHELRESVNRISGDWGRNSGVAWGHLKRGVEQHGLMTYGLTDEHGRLRQWTMDDLLAETQQGRPVIILAHYRSLPTHENASWYGDHYIVFLGMTADGQVVYHDPALRDHDGNVMVTDQARFERAWTSNWGGQNRTAMAIGNN